MLICVRMCLCVRLHVYVPGEGSPDLSSHPSLSPSEGWAYPLTLLNDSDITQPPNIAALLSSFTEK